MTSILRFTFVIFVGIAVFACTSARHSLPVMTRYAAVQSSTQQDALATAAEKAVGAIIMPSGQGRRTACRLAAVLPQPNDDINDFIRVLVESRLAAAGWIVLPKADSTVGARCMVTVSAAGSKIDLIQDELSAGRVAGNAFLQFPTLFTSWIWLPIYPTKRFYVSHVRLSVHLIPTGDGVAAWSGEGQGSMRLQYAGPGHDHYPVIEGTAFRDVAERKVDSEKE